MNAAHKKQLTAELAPHANTEAAALADLADQLSRLTQPHRSTSARKAGLRIVQEFTKAEKPITTFKWILAAPAFALLAIFALSIFAQGAVPGDKTYTIKLLSENVQLKLALSPEQKANLCSGQMKRRANELASLHSSRMQPAVVNDLTDSILDEAQEFQDFIKVSENKNILNAQRARDALYVEQTLSKIDRTNLNKEAQQDIDNTIQKMHAISQA